ncbi:hypothetical protein BDV38DRAFT_251089 [Aspergillus pseudotamarii]|uniref:Uncharacterized protein n=1 Tax=Aspergillus pseudotamarii TaxID=132259 RepID=A0A5N6SPS7_ASPPS|nr:uncharacterized protein BDV38DRAFT_251089 [Aspergillus pseudotamarii]KAE8135849.1 hypothetical protein BDV38DRAFT_251089 [Aspergillus pseudotamarii]
MAQLVERMTSNHEVRGSNPRGSILISFLPVFLFHLVFNWIIPIFGGPLITQHTILFPTTALPRGCLRPGGT